jgi:gamma-glutamyltranspeptidase/glutathione hydrolase
MNLAADAVGWAETRHPASTFENATNMYGEKFITYFPNLGASTNPVCRD